MAASLTSLVRYTAKTAAAYDARPSSVLAQVNRALRQRPRLAPVTMVSGLLADGKLTLAVGGHPLPLLKPGDGGPCRKVGATGMLLGAVHDYDGAHDVTVPLAPGDTLLLYTDGVTDTPGETGRFGEARLMEAVDAAPAGPRRAVADRLAHARRLRARHRARRPGDARAAARRMTAGYRSPLRADANAGPRRAGDRRRHRDRPRDRARAGRAAARGWSSAGAARRRSRRRWRRSRPPAGRRSPSRPTCASPTPSRGSSTRRSSASARSTCSSTTPAGSSARRRRRSPARAGARCSA